jgi:hypothetical protein
VGHAPADERFCDRLLDQLVGGLATAGRRSAGVRPRAKRRGNLRG